MSAFEVGQTVACVDVGTNSYITLGRHYVVREFGHRLWQEYVEIIRDDGGVSSYYAERFRQTTIPTSYRTTDPVTSKGKRKVNKYEQAVLAVLSGAHHTGQEIADVSCYPLNCITPRFAPLRRKGLIKDSGVKRDKQIVWCLA